MGKGGFGQGLRVKLILQRHSDPPKHREPQHPQTRARVMFLLMNQGAQEYPEMGVPVKGSIRGLWILENARRKPFCINNTLLSQELQDF